MNNSIFVIHGIINISFSVIPKTTHPIIVYKFRGIAYFALYSTQRTTFDQIYPLNYDAFRIIVLKWYLIESLPYSDNKVTCV